jgi:hypothetical protein
VGPAAGRCRGGHKGCFCKPPLHLPTTTRRALTILQTDASNVAMGAVLSQLVDGEERPVCLREQDFGQSPGQLYRYGKGVPGGSVGDRVVQNHALGVPFTLETDHSALRQILNDKESTGRLARWSLKPAGV